MSRISEAMPALTHGSDFSGQGLLGGHWQGGRQPAFLYRQGWAI